MASMKYLIGASFDNWKVQAQPIINIQSRRLLIFSTKTKKIGIAHGCFLHRTKMIILSCKRDYWILDSKVSNQVLYTIIVDIGRIGNIVNMLELRSLHSIYLNNLYIIIL